MAGDDHDNAVTDKEMLARLHREQGVIHQVAPRQQRVRRAEFRHIPAEPEPLDLEAIEAAGAAWLTERQLAALLAVVRRLLLQVDACDVCHTSSWTPTPEGRECQLCRAEAELVRLRQRHGGSE